MISMLTDIDRDEAQCVFIFPEGTDLSNSNITKSNACKSFRMSWGWVRYTSLKFFPTIIYVFYRYIPIHSNIH